MTKKQLLSHFFAKYLDHHNPKIVEKAAWLITELEIGDSRTIDKLYDFYELTQELNQDKSIAAKKMGSSRSSKKTLAAKQNAQKAGRHYEYIIFGDNSRILGSATGRKKDELIEKLKQMFIDQSEISLKLASKASDEERKIAREGTIITPTAVII